MGRRGTYVAEGKKESRVREWKRVHVRIDIERGGNRSVGNFEREDSA